MYQETMKFQGVQRNNKKKQALCKVGDISETLKGEKTGHKREKRKSK
jgi:hypothetical protein